MGYAIALLMVELTLAFVLLPIRVKAALHFSLDSKNAHVVVAVFGVKMLVVRAKFSNAVKITLNGKQPKRKRKGGFDMKKIAGIAKLPSDVQKAGIAFSSRIGMLAGGMDAKNLAIASALLDAFNVEHRYLKESENGGKFDVEISTAFRINPMQTMRFALYFAKNR